MTSRTDLAPEQAGPRGALQVRPRLGQDERICPSSPQEKQTTESDRDMTGTLGGGTVLRDKQSSDCKRCFGPSKSWEQLSKQTEPELQPADPEQPAATASSEASIPAHCNMQRRTNTTISGGLVVGENGVFLVNGSHGSRVARQGKGTE